MVVFDRYTAPPIYSAILFVKLVLAMFNIPPNCRYAPPKLEEHFSNNEFDIVDVLFELAVPPLAST